MRAKIKPLSTVELKNIATELQSLVGARLQDVFQSTEGEVGLEFFHLGRTIWLWFDLNPQAPMLLNLTSPPADRRKTIRPLTLFVRSRFHGRKLAQIEIPEASGRILVFSFHRASDESVAELAKIEVRLFPHGQNILLTDGEKSISELKPHLLPPSLNQAESLEHRSRTWPEILHEWQSENKPAEAGAVKAKGTSPLIKKIRALEKLREELKIKQSSPERELGLWLKAHGDFDAPEHLRGLLDEKKSLSWNIENLFQKAKEKTRKLQGTIDRIAKVEREIEELKTATPAMQNQAADRAELKAKNDLLNKAEARGRKSAIGENQDLEFYVGKSAADNLALLRRAQPFDYWLHLRDQPGAHGILRRTRGRNVTDQEFAQAARELIERARGEKGDRFDVLIVECRFVRPIKGDRLGRVNYTNDRVLTVKY